MKMNEIVEKYIALRDKKALMKKEFDKSVEEINTVMAKLEGIVLKEFQESGLDSVKTKAGTAYKSTRTSVTTADWDAVLAFIKDEQAWEMLEHRLNKKAVEQYREVNDDLPPGVNWREEIVINVRRN